jgi:hypothetical protein
VHLTTGSRLHGILLVCGVVGPLVFAAAYTLDGLSRPGHDAMSETLSTLSLGRQADAALFERPATMATCSLVSC